MTALIDVGPPLADHAAVWVLTYLLHSTVLIAGAWAVTRFLRLEPAARDFVWRVSMLGGAVTATGALLTVDRGTESGVVRTIAVEESVGGERILVGRGDGAVVERIRTRQRRPAPEGAAPPAWSGAPDGRQEVVVLRLAGEELAVRERLAAHRAARAPPERAVRLGVATRGGAEDLGADASGPAGAPEPRPSSQVEALRWVGSGPAASGAADATGQRAACDAVLRDAAIVRGGPPGGWLRRVDEACAGAAARGWVPALLLVWLLGAGCALLSLWRSRGAVADLERTLGPVGPRPRSALSELGVRPASVRVMASPHLAAPCALSGSTIGLPTRCEDELDDGELRAVLAHELAHIVRRDVGWSGVLQLIAAVLWLQPLNRFALRRSREATEEACDDWAVARTGAGVSLASSISRVAEWATGTCRDPVVVSMAAGKAGVLSKRVRRILAGSARPERRWRRIVAAALIAVPLPFLPTVPSQPGAHASIWIEERVAVMTTPAAADEEVDSLRARIIVARFRAD